jgi:diguanylate cyclase (GGDEF)-like protein
LQPGVIDGLRMSVERGIAGWVARHRQALRLDDASEDPRHDKTIGSETNFRPRGMLCVPVVSKDQLLGVIQVINRIGGGSFDDEELRLVQILADHAAIAIENASLYRRAELASLTDDLTGLSNSRHLNQYLPEQIRRGATLALLVLDFDNFKQVVDRYGHLVGSQTIGHIGRLIGRMIRPGDFAARFGGDEFVVILPDTKVAYAVEFAEKLRAEIAACTQLDGRRIDLSAVTASIGVAVFPDHAADADGLLHAADAAMYVVKGRGKNSVGVAAKRSGGAP